MHPSTDWITDWLIDWMIDWWFIDFESLTDWLIGWLITSLIHSEVPIEVWMIDSLIDWLVDWLIDWLVDWFLDWLLAWLFDWRLIDRGGRWGEVRWGPVVQFKTNTQPVGGWAQPSLLESASSSTAPISDYNNPGNHKKPNPSWKLDLEGMITHWL